MKMDEQKRWEERDEAEVRAKVETLALSDDSTRRKVICALVGHSRIVTGCFGYISCARPGA